MVDRVDHEFVGREAAERFAPAGEFIGSYESGGMREDFPKIWR